MGRAMARPARAMLVLGCLAALLHGQPPLGAQEPLEERTGTAEAPIYEDNVDAARGRAVRGAQRNAVFQVVREILAPEWVSLFQTELKNSILAHPEQYITSYRVERLETSADRTRYVASLAAQVNRARIVRDIRALSLPVKTDPLRRMIVYYRSGDPVLGRAAFRQEALAAIGERMKLLNFQVKGIRGLAEQEAQMLAGASGDAAARGAWLSAQNIAAGLFVAFARKPASENGQESETQSEVTAQLYQAGNGLSLGSFTAKTSEPLGRAGGSAQSRRALMNRLVAPLVAQLQPGGIRAFGPEVGGAAPLEVRLLGLSTVEDEEAFVRGFFRAGSPFARFFVYRLDRGSVSYRGTFGGDRRSLELDLPGKTYGDFRISNVFWFNDVLEIEVARDSRPSYGEARLFPPSERPAGVAELLSTFLSENPELLLTDPEFTEAEDNSWLKRSNRTPFNTTIYGFIDSRSDSDFYVADELKENEVLAISWYRVGRTNLNPAVRIYDGEGRPIRFYHPKNWIRTKYRVPKGQHKVFIEVSDRFAGIKWDSGGYLAYHYLILVERPGKD